MEHLASYAQIGVAIVAGRPESARPDSGR